MCCPGGDFCSLDNAKSIPVADVIQQRFDHLVFFFQAEDGIRDVAVTGVQTCALPILSDEYSMISDDCSTIYIRQAIWRGKEQDPKTDAAVRDVDVPKELAALLSEFAGDRKEGFLFCSASGKPLSARNIVRDNLHPALLALKQPRAGFHCFRRFRESVLQMSDARRSEEHTSELQSRLHLV